MARKAGVEYGEAVYHVMDRGDRREAIYRDDADRRRFLETLAQGRGRSVHMCNGAAQRDTMVRHKGTGPLSTFAITALVQSWYVTEGDAFQLDAKGRRVPHRR
jgi:hypothetical protein